MAEAPSANDIDQYLTFTIAGELFALDIGSVREVLEPAAITRVPRTPDYIRGVINLRGCAVPVVDLKCRFGLGATEHTVDTCIIIVEVRLDDEAAVFGALADSAREVCAMDAAQIQPAPRMSTPIRGEFIRGIGTFGEELVMILDGGAVFTCLELAGLPQDRDAAAAETAGA